MSSEILHVPRERLSKQTLMLHYAIVSLMEELEAVDWYQQRVEATGDDELRQILAHNRDEEKEHAAMILEWIRRHDAKLDAVLHEYLFTSGNIVRIEAAAAGDNGAAAPAARPTLGSLRGER